MIDLHNHILINVDDGPRSEADTLALLNQAIEQGITDIVATPHHQTRQYNTPGEVIHSKLKEVQNIIDHNQLDIKVHPGQEIHINGDIIKELKSGVGIPLNHSKYVLVELPFNSYPAFIDNMIYEIQMSGYIPVIAHPERCRPLFNQPSKLLKFVEEGAAAQVTAGSVTGKLGESIQEMSLKMIENHLVHIVSSDAHHAESRPFELKEAYEVILETLDESYVIRLTHNAEAILNDRPIKVKPPQNFTMNDRKRRKKKKKFFGLF